MRILGRKSEIRLVRLRTFGRSHSQQSTGLFFLTLVRIPCTNKKLKEITNVMALQGCRVGGFFGVLDFRQSLRILYRSTARRAENLSPKGFLFALSNPLQIKQKRSNSCGITSFSWRAARDSNP